MAGIAAAATIKGNNVTSVTVEDGAITILYAGLSANTCGSATPSLTHHADGPDRFDHLGAHRLGRRRALPPVQPASVTRIRSGSTPDR